MENGRCQMGVELAAGSVVKNDRWKWSDGKWARITSRFKSPSKNKLS